MKFWQWVTGRPFVSYTEQIQALKPEKCLPLPPVKAMKARVRYPLPRWASGQVVRFRKRG